MATRRFSVPVTTDASGNATAYSPYLSGFIESVHYVKTDYADGVDFTITADATGESIWTESNVNAATSRYPTAPTHTGAGAPVLYASGGTAVTRKVALSRDRVKIALAQGGNAKSGSFTIVISD